MKKLNMLSYSTLFFIYNGKHVSIYVFSLFQNDILQIYNIAILCILYVSQLNIDDKVWKMFETIICNESPLERGQPVENMILVRPARKDQ